MIFSSPIFLFLFLPVVFAVYNLARNGKTRKLVLVSSSLFFYGWWEVTYLFIIIGSIAVNYCTYKYIILETKKAKVATILGILFNITLLIYFKYSFFIIENIQLFTGGLEFTKILLPLGISFFTFQQIAFLIDSFKTKTDNYSLLDYTLFVTFFPQLIAGPIVHHSDMMPQFASNPRVNYPFLIKGLLIFTIGIFKKLIIADTFAVWANAGFSNSAELTFLGAWLTTISYTIQLYYDFSGYCDMAIGLGLIFGIKLPVNFNSPYKALNIQDFWRRWHITLSVWLRDYIYIPLGGNRNGNASASVNVLITFLIGGAWHGAGWNFVIWGGLHGIALACHRAWANFTFKIPALASWAITLLFVHFAWIFFRAEDFPTALNIIAIMLSVDLDITGLTFLAQNTINFNLPFIPAPNGFSLMAGLLIVVMACTVFAKNSLEIAHYDDDHYAPSKCKVAVFGALLGVVSLTMFLTSTSPFLYFNF